jgi:hypothetical protein
MSSFSLLPGSISLVLLAPILCARSLSPQEPDGEHRVQTSSASSAAGVKPGPAVKKISQRSGGDPAERAILDGLRWLVRHQNPDGSWSATSLAERCQADAPCFDPHDAFTNRYDAETTSLALLCFFHAGFTSESKQDIVDTVFAKRHNVGDVVKRGLESLVHRQSADGSFSTGRSLIDNDAWATLALVEAWRAKHESAWMEPAQRGVEFLERAQRRSPNGESPWGWARSTRIDAEIDAHNAGRSPGSEVALELADSDTSSTALCAAVLHTAQDNVLIVKPESLGGALEFTRAMTRDDGSVSYRDARVADPYVVPSRAGFADHAALLSAQAMCTRFFADRLSIDPFFDLAAKKISKDLPTVSPDKGSIDYDYWNWGTLALNQVDGLDSLRRTGKYWRNWDHAATAAITSLQVHDRSSCRDGGWIEPDRWSLAAGPIYTTAMSVLALEVRFAIPDAHTVLAQAAEVGSSAPPFDRLDVDGERLESSKLAGRVIVLDPWMASELPGSLLLNLRDSLLDRYEGSPLVLVGILRGAACGFVLPESIRDRRKVWRWIQVDGDKDPLWTDYYAMRATGIVVIDPEGVIRGRDLSWKETVELVGKLVADAESKRPK